MPLQVDGVNIDIVLVDGVAMDIVTLDGVEVFSSAKVDLSGISNIIVNNVSNDSAYIFNVNGTHFEDTDISEQITTDWFVNGDIAKLEVRMSFLSGDIAPSPAAVDTWLAISNWQWRIVIPAPSGLAVANVRLEIRVAASGTVIGTRDFQLKVDF